MLTVRLWRTLIRTSKRQTLRRVIAPDALQLRISRGYRVASFIGFFVWILFPFILPALLINLLCLRLTVKIAHAISRRRELGQQDLLAITPVGTFSFILETCRAYIYFTHQEISRFLRSGVTAILITGGFACTVPVTISIVLTNTSQELLVVFMIFLSATLILSFWEYIQLATLAVLLGILAGSSKDRVSAQSWAIGLLTGVQFSLYGGWLWIVSATVRTPIEIFLTLMFFSPLLFIIREGVIFVLWRVLRHRFKDDLQTAFAT
jgi:hypothetical protein